MRIALSIAVILFGIVGGAIGAERPQSRRFVYVTVTNYCPCKVCCGKWAKGLLAERRTANGVLLRPGLAAGDVAIFPRGAVVLVPGYGSATVVDTGSQVRGWHLDLYVHPQADTPEAIARAHKAALTWGRQRLRVCVIAACVRDRMVKRAD